MKNIFKKIILNILILEAKIILKKSNPKIIAVTGNLGKTSTKDLIYFALKDNFKNQEGESLIHASPKSLNSDFGVPLTILNLPTGYSNFWIWIKNIFLGLIKIFEKVHYKYLILEIGADGPNDIKNVCKYIKPDIAILSAFAEVPVHIEFFENDRNKLVREKKYLIENLKKNGIFIYNQDDEDCQKIRKEIEIENKQKNKNIFYQTFSFKDKTANIFAENIISEAKENEYKLVKVLGVSADIFLEQEAYKIFLKNVLGEAIISSVLPAILVAKNLNLDIQKVISDLQDSKRTNGRMRILEGIYNTILIDDSYNSSPKALEHGIKILNQISLNKKQKKIFVLGDMLELGNYTKSEHQRLGKYLVKKCDILFTSGIRAKDISLSAIENGMDGENVFQFNNSLDTGKALLLFLEKEIENEYKTGKIENEIGGHLIYIKGSQGSRMEIISKILLAKNHHPSQFLVRQDEYWLNKK